MRCAGRHRRPSAALVAALWLSTGVGTALAQPITDNDYRIDMVQGPVLGSGRIVGLGGAYSAIAEGIDGVPWNPAAYGSRTLWEQDWFEWELTAGILFPGAFSGDDFFNTGEVDGAVFDRFIFLSFGFRLQFGDVGFGGLPRLSLYQLTPPGETEPVNVSFIVGNYGIAHQFLNGQLVLGFGARTASLDISRPDGELVSFTSTGPEVGGLLRLAEQPWRLGVAFRSAVVDDRPREEGVCPDPMVTCMSSGFVLPDEVHMPWEVQVGFALQIGNRPFNRVFVNPDDVDRDLRAGVGMERWERERAQVELEMARAGETPPPPDPYRWLPRRAGEPAFHAAQEARREADEEEIESLADAAEQARDEEVKALTRLYLLISAEVLITGPTPSGVGVQHFLQQQGVPSGEEATYGFRLGIEGEPWAGRLKLRGGGYLEPSRIAGVGYRLHGTAGFDLRLFSWDLFGLFDDFDVRAGATVDVAERFFDWGIGVGFWH